MLLKFFCKVKKKLQNQKYFQKKIRSNIFISRPDHTKNKKTKKLSL